jgi:serine/threonine protein kinase
MNACMAAGVHPHLVHVLGQITDHPEAKKGLVLHLIPPAYKNLGGPPDFATCTRDTYAANTTFSLEQVLAVAKAMAQVGAHLHERGIMHGDLYAHNILTDEAGGVLLVDYGAASMYNRNGAHAAAIERIEVSAYGCLLDDMLTRFVADTAYSEVAQALTALRDSCMQEQVLQRPAFSAVVAQLAVITGGMITGVE